jgi:hypothetical protein
LAGKHPVLQISVYEIWLQNAVKSVYKVIAVLYIKPTEINFIWPYQK